ncbi:Hypothetical predicted protein [Cloeon dipterum]|uniref:Uncharacterized protein n=1 Tax=Cloeon dipterum TaxID=197152 RepID=A0A8S1E1W7_9INSE|nr:Hypothetical predicted protein [Cloeon dipterum]
MHRLVALLALLMACVVALTMAMPSPDGEDVVIQPAELVFEEHLPSDGQQSDKTLAKFVEELLALRNKPL